MSTILVTGAAASSAATPSRRLLDAGHRVVALVRDADSRRRSSSTACRPPGATASRSRIGDVTEPATLAAALAGVDAVLHLVAIPRDFRGGADLRLVNTEGTRAVVEAMKAAGVRRLVHMGAMGVEDDPGLHYASSKAKAEALVAASGLDWTILKPSLQFGQGDGFFNIVADLVRLSPGRRPGAGRRRQPVPADPRRRRRARWSSRAFADPTTIGGSFELGGPRYWTYREITARGRSPRWASAASSSRCPCRSSGSSPATAERVRDPVPGRDRPASPARASTTSGRSTSSRQRFGFAPRPMEGALGYLRAKSRDQRTRGDVFAGRSRAADARPATGSHPRDGPGSARA